MAVAALSGSLSRETLTGRSTRIRSTSGWELWITWIKRRLRGQMGQRLPCGVLLPTVTTRFARLRKVSPRDEAAVLNGRADSQCGLCTTDSPETPPHRSSARKMRRREIERDIST